MSNPTAWHLVSLISVYVTMHHTPYTRPIQSKILPNGILNTKLKMPPNLKASSDLCAKYFNLFWRARLATNLRKKCTTSSRNRFRMFQVQYHHGIRTHTRAHTYTRSHRAPWHTHSDMIIENASNLLYDMHYILAIFNQRTLKAIVRVKRLREHRDWIKSIGKFANETIEN